MPPPAAPAPSSPRTIALIGNPNTGKSTLFNALSGVRQRTGNYPGVTVEKKEGRLQIGDRTFTVIDLPGTYSLAPRSPDEMIAVDVLLGRRADTPPPDVILCIVDASNLERNLYLVNQVLELGRPTVLALNMVDVAATKGLKLHLDRLRAQLPVSVVEIQAHRKVGLDALHAALLKAADHPPHATVSPFPEPFQAEVAKLEQLERDEHQPVLPRYLVERLLLDSTGYLERANLPGVTRSILTEVRAARQRLAERGLAVPGVEAVARYGWVSKALEGVVERPKQRPITWGDRLDRVLTHRIAGTLLFVLLMAIMFQAVYWVAEPAKLALDWAKGHVANRIESQMEDSALRSLLLNGVVEGVGGVLVFLPQIFTLFFFIAILEDCGYMARAAYLMDRIMAKIGLNGRSFIPLLSSFACAIPGIMSARVIENPRDRLVTILVAPLMSCSARLPVYWLLVNAFFPDVRYLGGVVTLRGLIILAMYAIGILAAVGVALILKRTLLRGATPPFVMELPSYKLPGPGIVLMRMLDRGWAFVRRAGTLILAVSVLIWAAAYFPRDPSAFGPEQLAKPVELRARFDAIERQLAIVAPDDPAHAELIQQHEDLKAEQKTIEHEMEGLYLRHSYLGQLGTRLEFAVRPLGWDWRIGCAALASFPAREVVVASLGVIYNLGADADAESDSDSDSLQATLRNAKWDGSDRKVFNIPVALSLMVFFALCAQCVSTLAVIRRETNSWRWPIFTFAYMTGLAYVGALVTYQVGMLF